MISINPWELFWTVINFFLLYFILKNLLYKPIIRFMDERQARIDAGFAAEKKAQEALTSSKAQLTDEKAKCAQDARERLERDKAAYEAKQAQLARAYHDKSTQKRQELKKTVAENVNEEQARFDENEQELAELLITRLLCADKVESN